MANEALAWALPPAVTNADDGTQCYNLGTAFTVSGTVDAPGCQLRVPDSVVAPQGGPHAVAIWNEDTGVRLAYAEFTPAVGTTQDVLFGAPITLSAGVNYVAAWYANHYVYRATSPAGTTTPSGKGTATGGRLASYNGGAAAAPIPAGSPSTTFYISPLLVVASAVTGAAALTLPPLAAAGAGVATASAAAAFTLRPLQAFGAGVASAAATAALTLPPLALAGAGTAGVSGAGTLTLAPLQALGAGTAGAAATAALVLPVLQASGSAGPPPVATGALVLPALKLSAAAHVNTPPATGLVGIYRGLVAQLGALLKDAGAPLRVVTDVAEPVGRRDVVLGPPTWLWEGFCSPTQPTGCNIDVYLIENLEKRAIDRLLENLPTLLTAVAQLGEESIVIGCVPGAFPSGTVDLPCYQITAEITF